MKTAERLSRIGPSYCKVRRLRLSRSSRCSRTPLGAVQTPATTRASVPRKQIKAKTTVRPWNTTTRHFFSSSRHGSTSPEGASFPEREMVTGLPSKSCQPLGYRPDTQRRREETPQDASHQRSELLNSDDCLKYIGRENALL